MGIHGVDADEQLSKSTQMDLHALIRNSERLVCF